MMFLKTAKTCLALLLGITCLSTSSFIHMKATEHSDEDMVNQYIDSLKNKNEVDSPAPRGAIPSQSQIDYYKDELSGFIHFGPNTFTGNEWGHGTPEEIQAFNPTELNTDQWVQAFKDAGFKKIIITAKHHDGFQLWPSAYSERNVKNSPFGIASEDQGDILAQLSESCSKLGMDMGLYLSPWDMGEPSYGEHVKVYRDDGEMIMEVNADGSLAYLKPGVSENTVFWGRIDVVNEDEDGTSLDPNGDYNELYMNQLKEVLTNDKYGRDGRFKEIWMDGAKNDPRYQQYDLKEWWQLCRELEPDVMIFNNIGNDVRWVGNESGFSYDPIWAQVDADKMWNDYNLGINSKPTATYPSKLKIITKDGSKRWAYADSYEDGGYLTKGDPNGTTWSMPESDYSIIGDWFWKNKAPQSAKDMVESYFQTVGNATPMLLNTPPNQKGLLEDSYVKNMKEFRSILDNTYAENVVAGATAIASSTYENAAAYTAENVIDEDFDSYWAAEEGKTTGEVTVFLNEVKQFDLINLKEYIPLGQNISSYDVEVRVDGKWQTFGKTSGTRKNKKTIGYQSILRDNTVNADAIRLKITGSYGSPKISGISAFKMDERIEFSKGSDIVPAGLNFIDSHSASTSGKWDKTDKDTVRKNSMFSNDLQASAQYTFTGSRFFLSSRYSPNFGGIKVTIDNEEPVLVDLNALDATISSVVFRSKTLAYGKHTVLLQPVELHGKVGMATDGLYYLDNQNIGMFEIENPEINVDEAQVSTLIVQRLGGSKGEASVHVSTSPGTAVHGRHYESIHEELIFADGETQKEILLPTIDNDETTGTLFYTASLSDGKEAIIGFNKKATIYIEDNEFDASKLVEAIEKAKRIEEENYSEKMQLRLKTLIENAEVFIAKDHLKQSQIDAYLSSFLLALEGIKESGTYAELSATNSVTFEAEDGELENGATFFDKNSHPNFANLSGTGMVGNLIGNAGLTIWFDAPYTGTYKMDIQVYSGGKDRLYFTNGKGGEEAIEGSANIPYTGGGGTVKSVSVDMYVPVTGMNYITFKQRSSEANHPNMDNITFTYSYVDVEEVRISTEKDQIFVGDELQMASEIKPDNASDKTLSWTVDNQEIAQVDSTGKVYALESGIVNINAKSVDGAIAEKRIKILPKTEKLVNKIQEARTIAPAGYTKDSYANLNAKIIDAEDQLKYTYIKQADVHNLEQQIEEAIEQLVVKQDKLVLNNTVQTAKLENDNLPLYIHKVVKANFLTALENAQAVLDSETADMLQINQVNAKLSTTMHMLSFLADYTSLDDKIQIAEDIQKQLDTYEESGKEAFLVALEFAKQIRLDIMSINEDIFLATTQLQEAIEQLKPIGDTQNIQRDILQAVVQKALEIKDKGLLNGLVEKVQQNFNASLQQAIIVLANEDSSASELMDAWLNMADAMHYLDFKADKTQLEAFIEECELLNLSEYEETGKAEFKAALKTANVVFEDENALQAGICKAYDALLSAKNNLIPLQEKLNKKLLSYMIEQANSILGNEAFYENDESWEYFKNALIEAKQVLTTATSQSELNHATVTLADAYESIRLIANEERLTELQHFVNSIRQMNLRNYKAEDAAVIQYALEYTENLMQQSSFTLKDYTQFLDLQVEISHLHELVDAESTHFSKPKEIIPDSTKQIAKTGDTTYAGRFMNIALAAMAVIVGSKVRKNKKLK